MIKNKRTAMAVKQKPNSPSQRVARAQALKVAQKQAQGRKTAPKVAYQKPTPLSQAPKNTQRLASSTRRPSSRPQNRRNYMGNRAANRR